MPYLCLLSSRLLKLDVSAGAASLGELHLDIELTRPNIDDLYCNDYAHELRANEHMDDVPILLHTYKHTNIHTYKHTYNSYLPVIGVHEMHQLLSDNYFIGS